MKCVKLSELLLFTLALVSLNPSISQGSPFGVDLHVHLFMKETMGRALRGTWDGPLAAESWKDIRSTKANRESLEKSGAQIVVASLYAIGGKSARDDIRRQVKDAFDFVRQSPQWIIAKDPLEAGKALDEGKQVLILSLEGSSGILETEEDFKEFIDQDLIRIVTPIHFRDDRFGGSAFMGGLLSFINPLERLEAWIKGSSTDGVPVNPLGLKPQGIRHIGDLIKRHVWVDLSHASDQSQKEIARLYGLGGLPLLYTHTSLRSEHPAERSLSQSQLIAVRESGGVVGLMPAKMMLQSSQNKSPTLQDFINQFCAVQKFIGSSRVFLGSDFNAPLAHLPGFWNLAQERELWATLREKCSLKSDAEDPAQTFLGAWSKIYSFP